MNSEQFCYWLQGRAELMPQIPPNKEEWDMIKDHLNQVFKKVTNPLAATWNEYQSSKPDGPYYKPGQPQLIC